mmetsp:Transcript_34107/g.87988  ORF Transcript_34107/g.87988 Transcript_34107/m.87988 type:complete len:171 (-) Transcript_34107:1778-2290(-)
MREKHRSCFNLCSVLAVFLPYFFFGEADGGVGCFCLLCEGTIYVCCQNPGEFVCFRSRNFLDDVIIAALYFVSPSIREVSSRRQEMARTGVCDCLSPAISQNTQETAILPLLFTFTYLDYSASFLYLSASSFIPFLPWGHACCTVDFGSSAIKGRHGGKRTEKWALLLNL